MTEALTRTGKETVTDVHLQGSRLIALVYLGLVFGGEALLVSIVGKNDGIVIVGSTLIVAMLFQPLRRGIQNVIDRRFYSQKYNAQHTLQAFSASLREEVDLTRLSEHIVAVVQETMQPASVSLWLLPSGRKALPLLPDSRRDRREARIDVNLSVLWAPQPS